MANLVKFYRGLFENWNAETHKNAIYFATDSGQIIFNDKDGNKLVSGAPSNITTQLGNAYVNASWVTPDIVRLFKANGTSTDIKLTEASATQKGLMSSTHFSKLEGIAEGAQVNVIEKIQLDGVDVAVSSKTANVAVANKIATAKSEAITAGAVTIAEESINAGGIYKKFTFSQGGSVIGTINTTKDLVVQEGSVVDDNLGGKILRLILNDENSTQVDIPVTDLVDVYTAGQYITIGEGNSISVNFGTLDAALIAETAQVGGAIKDAAAKGAQGISDAAAAQAKANAVGDALGEKTAAAATGANASAFSRIKNLEEVVGNLTGDGDGVQSVSGQINTAINDLKGTGFEAGTLAALEDRVDTNASKISTLTGEGEGSVAKALVDAKAYTDAREVVINGKIDSANQAVTGEKNRAEAEELRLAGLIQDNADALATVDTRISDAVTIEKNAREAADTAINNKIGSVAEGKTVVKMIEEAGAKATTKLAEGTDEGNHLTIGSSNNTDGSVTYTINLTDVASATALNTEKQEREAADKSNADAIKDVDSMAKDSKGKLETLMGESTQTGSIKQQIATAKSESYNDAKAYADSLAGNYDASGSAAAVQSNLESEVNRAKAAEEANAKAAKAADDKAVAAQNKANANEQAIAKLNGDASTEGSVAKAIAGVVGSSADGAAAETIYGAKKYADDLLTWHEA